MYCEPLQSMQTGPVYPLHREFFHILEASGTFLLGISKHRVLIKNNIAMFPEQAVMLV